MCACRRRDRGRDLERSLPPPGKHRRRHQRSGRLRRAAVRWRRWRDLRRAGRRDGSRVGRRGWLTARSRRCDRLRRGQEEKRVEVSLRVVGEADAQVHVRLRELRIAAWADRADVRSLGERLAPLYRVRAEVHERHRVTVGRLDRHGLAVARDRPGEGDGARDGSDDTMSGRRSDVDPAVLPGRVWVIAVEREQRQHRTRDGPAPPQRGSRRDQRGCESRGKQQAHSVVTSVVRNGNDGSVARRALVVKSDYRVAR